MQPVNVSAAQTWRACACLLWGECMCTSTCVICVFLHRLYIPWLRPSTKLKKKEIWALHVLPSFLNTIRSRWLGCELRGEMESCFRNSAEEEHVYVAADDWISLDCSFINSSLTVKRVTLILSALHGWPLTSLLNLYIETAPFKKKNLKKRSPHSHI